MLSFMPTSLYSKVDVTWATVVAWTVEVWIGMRSPMWNLACLLFRIRTRGFAKVWESESCLMRLSTMLGSVAMMLLPWIEPIFIWPVVSVVVALDGWRVAPTANPGAPEVWKFQPYFRVLLRDISRISTSRMTSASLRSLAAIVFSTSAIFSGVSRIVMELRTSFTYTFLVSSMVRRRFTVSFALALLR